MFMDWCIDLLVGVLNWHVAWRLLMHWRVGCVLNRRVGWRWLTDAWTCWLACWINMLVDVYWCTDVLVGMLNRHVGWRLLMLWPIVWYVESTRWMTLTVLINAIIADQLLQLVIKRHKKKKLYVYYTFKAGSKPSFCCSCKVKCKTQHHLNRGMLQYIRLKQAV